MPILGTIINGQRVTGGGGAVDASIFAGDFTQADGAAETVVPLVDLAIDGAWAMFRGVVLSAVQISGALPLASFSIIYAAPNALAQRNSVDGAVLYGAPPPTAAVDAGYLAPGTFAPAGVPGAVLRVSGTQIELAFGPSPAGFDMRASYVGQLWVFDGATRLHA